MNKIALRKIKFKIVILFLIFFIISTFLDFKFRPVAKNIALAKARVIATKVVNESVLDDMSNNLSDYQDIVHLDKNGVGEILAICSNIEKINRLKAHISLLIQQNLDDLKAKNISVAAGTLTGFEILNGRGPSLPLKISASGSVLTDFKSDFSSTGINQTLHQIHLCVSTKISVIIPGCSCSTELDTTILISETIIVGKVPSLPGAVNSANINNNSK